MCIILDIFDQLTEYIYGTPIITKNLTRLMVGCHFDSYHVIKYGLIIRKLESLTTGIL